VPGERPPADAIITAAERLLADRTTPILIALDGPSGAGKSALASFLAKQLDATIVPSDHFFAAEITRAGWDARSARDRAAEAIDWRRMRRDALEPLRASKPARWHAFDFDAGTRPDGTYAMQAAFTERQPARVIILDGVYSTRPELADLIDLSVLVDVPMEVRRERLAVREAASFLESWHSRWAAAEAYYFAKVRPLASFDLVVSTA
jgi:uridine kinase